MVEVYLLAWALTPVQPAMQGSKTIGARSCIRKHGDFC
jgi:hypothetical protein